MMKPLSHGALAVLLALATLTQVQAGAPAPDDSTYTALGGKEGIRKIVALFIPLIQADARIGESFRDADMDNLVLRLEQQFCELSGGPCKYEGKDMAEIHDGLDITNAQFNALTEDLQLAMERSGIPSRVQNRLVAKLAPLQRAVVTK